MQEKIFVAKLGKTVGLNGQQKLHIDSDFPEQFKKNSIFHTDKNQELTIESYNPNNSSVKFYGIDTIESAKKLTNKQLYVTQKETKEMCNLKDKQFFWFDIINCTIVENGISLGSVNDVQRMPTSDYLQIETTQELQNQKMSNVFLLPYTDDYIIDVNISKNVIIVKNAVEILEAS